MYVQLDVPRVPGLGLVLEQVHFEQYDLKFAKLHGSLGSWPECEVRRSGSDLDT